MFTYMSIQYLSNFLVNVGNPLKYFGVLLHKNCNGVNVDNGDNGVTCQYSELTVTIPKTVTYYFLTHLQCLYCCTFKLIFQFFTIF